MLFVNISPSQIQFIFDSIVNENNIAKCQQCGSEVLSTFDKEVLFVRLSNKAAVIGIKPASNR